MKKESLEVRDVGEKIIVCDECSAEFLMTSVKIEECSVRVGDKELLLDYFVCPKCNKIYKVLFVEEQRYRELIDDLLETEKRIRKLKGRGNVQLLSTLQRMALTKKQRVQTYVNGMNNKYPGTFTFSSVNKEEIIYLP